MGNRFGRALIHVVLLAMMMRALLPGGWMLGPASDGAMSLVICSTSGLNHVDGGDRHPDSRDQHQNDACPFAAASHMATPATGFTLAPPQRIVLSAPRFLTPIPAPVSATYQPHAPRAPPFSA